jgi:hypothetical protein
MSNGMVSLCTLGSFGELTGRSRPPLSVVATRL